MIRPARPPGEERSFVDHADAGRGDPGAGVQSGQPENAEVSPGTGDGFGDLRQSRMNHWKVEHR